MILQRCLICLRFIGISTNWFLGVMFVDRDTEKLTGPLDDTRVFLDFLFYI